MRDLNYREELGITGGRHDILETLIRTVSSVCRSDRNVRHFYLGIASGTSPQHALARRVDDYKEANDIDEMVLLYKSSSQRFCREVENYLISYYLARHASIINRRAGRAGRPTTQPYSYVYLAVCRIF